MRYLLDTNICIYLIKKHPREVLIHFKKHSPRDVGISIITVFELDYGVNKSRFQKHSREALDKFLMPLNILSLDRSSAREAAEIRVELEAKGRPIGPYDLLIAGIARSRNLIVVTNNAKEFGRVKGLSHENWAV